MKKSRKLNLILAFILSAALIFGGFPEDIYAENLDYPYMDVYGESDVEAKTNRELEIELYGESDAEAKTNTESENESDWIFDVKSGNEADGLVKGTYEFSSTSKVNTIIEDTFVYSDEYFKKSSFDQNIHLSLLSCQAGAAAMSYYQNNDDGYSADYSHNADKIVAMLSDMGFEDVETNNYYSMEKLPESVAVALGHRNIRVYGQDYTLIAIIPRGVGYKREWASNLIFGKGNIHEGFKTARDEILRFTKLYIEQHKIRGKLKVWAVGNSRGAGISNLLGGFFAGGGIEYFGDKVTIRPEDVYCYTTGTPQGVIKKGTPKSEVLSVEGARGGIYSADTPGEDYISYAQGSVDPKAEEYSGVIYIDSYYDCLTHIPPEDWGFQPYGLPMSADMEGQVSLDDMLAQLKTFDEIAYNSILKNDFSDYSPKTWDMVDLKFKNSIYGDKEQDIIAFADQRFEGFVKLSPSNEVYVRQGYEKTITSFLAMIRMLDYVIAKSFEEGENQVDYIKPATFIYLSYAVERLVAEDKAQNEEEGLIMAMGGLISHFTGKEIGLDQYTMSDLLRDIFQLFVDNPDAPMTRAFLAMIKSSLPEDSAFMFYGLFGSYMKNPDKFTDEDKILGFMKAFIYGPEKGSSAARQGKDLKDARGVMFSVIKLFLEENENIVMEDFVGLDQEGSMDGSRLFKDSALDMIYLFAKDKDDQGKITFESKSIATIGNHYLRKLLNDLLAGPIESTREIYGQEYYEITSDYLYKLTYGDYNPNLTRIRRVISYFAFYTQGEEFSTESNINNGATLYSYIIGMAESHHPEVYLAWAKACVEKE
ncbi:MAG: hypothetical protein K6E10_11000 [Eubacterium sp.]|nr:hypothetical protein [Eubacterium sp.]